MATRKKSVSGDLSFELAPDVLELERVNMAHNEYLGTGALALGEKITTGPYNGWSVSGLFATPLGILIDLASPAGETATLYQNGANAGVLK